MILSEQTVIITGGAGSIGEFLVADLYQQVNKLIVIDKDEEKLKALKEKFGAIEIYSCDLTDSNKVSETITAISQAYNVSVLINNAGFIHSEPLLNILKPAERKHSFEAWDTTIKRNLYTAFFTTASVVDEMVAKRIKGVVINISSIAAKGNIGQTAYSAAKAGIEAMTVTWAKELGMFGIRSVAIAPGFFDTTSTKDSLTEANVKKWTKSVPLNRLGGLHELASAVKFIIDNDYFNGQTLELNGGLKI
jgi:3-oxoacyl-[acyl-carrier protein] reductase